MELSDVGGLASDPVRVVFLVVVRLSKFTRCSSVRQTEVAHVELETVVLAVRLRVTIFQGTVDQLESAHHKICSSELFYTYSYMARSVASFRLKSPK